MRMEDLTPEEIEHKKQKINKFLFKQLKSEAEDAEFYLEKAELAKCVGDTQLSTILVNIAKTEVEHFKSLMSYAENNIKGLSQNPLYVLLENLEEWVDATSSDLNQFR